MSSCTAASDFVALPHGIPGVSRALGALSEAGVTCTRNDSSSAEFHTFVGEDAGAAAKVCAHIFHARARCLWLQTQQSILANVDKDDGSDALVNAILVARGDALPTQFAGAFSSSSLRLGGGASPGVHALTISHKCMGVSPGDPGAM